MKPGWQTTEFWITLVSQVLALLAITGAISVGDREHLETALTNAVTAIFTLIASAMIVVGYIRSRTALKNTTTKVLLAMLTGLLLAGPSPAAQPSCFRPRGSDPAMLAVLQQIVQNQQTIIQLLQQQRPAAPPSIIMVNPQTIPLGAAPRQDIPLGGAPRQEVPLGGTPRQDVPMGAPPMQDVPLGPPPAVTPTAQRFQSR